MTEIVWLTNQNGAAGDGIFRFGATGVPTPTVPFFTNAALVRPVVIGLVQNGGSTEVWVGLDYRTPNVIRFDTAMNYLGTITNENFDGPFGILYLPSIGKVWITGGDHTIYVYNPDGTDTGVTYTPDGALIPGGLCVGPDGAVWLGNLGTAAYSLCRLNTDGTPYGGGNIIIPGYPPSSGIWGVVPVGARVWATNGGAIHVLDTSGALVASIPDPSGTEMSTLGVVGGEVWAPIPLPGYGVYRFDSATYARVGTIADSGFGQPYMVCAIPQPAPPTGCSGATPGVPGATLDVPVGSPSHLPALLGMVRPSINTDPAGAPAISLTTAAPLILTISGATLHVGVSVAGVLHGYDMDIAQATLCDVVTWLSPAGPILGTGHSPLAPVLVAGSATIAAMALVEMEATTTSGLVLQMGTAHPWCLLRTAALVLDVLAADQALALATLQIVGATAPWLDYIGALYNNPRLPLTTTPGGAQEPDAAYGVRVARDPLLPYANNVAIADVISQTTGLAVIVSDNLARPATFSVFLTGALPAQVTVTEVVALINRYKALGPVLTRVVERDAGVNTFMLSPHASTPGVLNSATSTLNEGLVVVWPL